MTSAVIKNLRKQNYQLSIQWLFFLINIMSVKNLWLLTSKAVQQVMHLKVTSARINKAAIMDTTSLTSLNLLTIKVI